MIQLWKKDICTKNEGRIQCSCYISALAGGQSSKQSYALVQSASCHASNNKPSSKVCTIENTPQYFLMMAIFASNTQNIRSKSFPLISLWSSSVPCDRYTAWNVGIFLQMALGSVCWRDVSTEEVARRSPAISHIIGKHFTDQICYKCMQTVLLEIPAESIRISSEYILFPFFSKNPRACNIIIQLFFYSVWQRQWIGNIVAECSEC